MTSDPPTKRHRRAAEEAASWLVTLRSEDSSFAERQEFVKWLRESPIHIAEMLRVSQIHGALAHFKGWSEIRSAESASSDSVIPFRRAAPSDEHATPRRRLSRLGIAVAAGVAAVSIVAALLVFRAGDSAINTAAGQRSEVSLADGSVVEVAPSTTLHVKLADKERHVVIDRGQAYFHVHKDATRPFIVDASGARIRAVGTAFNVDRTDNGVVVTVTEGRVAVSARARHNVSEPLNRSAAAALVMLGSNQQLSVFPDGTISPIKQTDGDAAVVWTTGQLDFDNQTIEDVLRHFNAYNRVQIKVQDPSLSARRVTGTFRLVDPESFVSFIQATTPGAVIRREGNLIVITSASAIKNLSDAPPR